MNEPTETMSPPPPRRKGLRGLLALVTVGAMSVGLLFVVQPAFAARAIIHGCQTYTADGFAFPEYWQSWNPAFDGFGAGKFRIADDCGGVRFAGRGTVRHTQVCLSVRLVLRDPDTQALSRGPWMSACPSGDSILLASSLTTIVNQDFYIEARSANANWRSESDWWHGTITG